MTNTTNKAGSTIRAINHFNLFNDDTFIKRGDYYAKDAAQEVTEFYDYAANGIARYLASGDVSHVNKVVQGALVVGRYRSFIRVAKSIVAHNFDKAGKKLIGKIDQKKLTKLITADADSGLENWELTLKKNIESETKFSKIKPAKAWNEDAAILQLIKKEVENKKDLTQLVDKVAAAIKAQAA